jgi:hypothetical protein
MSWGTATFNAFTTASRLETVALDDERLFEFDKKRLDHWTKRDADRAVSESPDLYRNHQWSPSSSMAGGNVSEAVRSRSPIVRTGSGGPSKRWLLI